MRKVVGIVVVALLLTTVLPVVGTMNGCRAPEPLPMVMQRIKDQSQEDCPEKDWIQGGEWQEFVPQGKDLIRVEVHVGCWYAGSPPLTLSVEHPLGTILASKTLPAVALPLNSEGWVSFEYLNTTLQPGQTYYIVLSFDPGAEYSWSGNWSNPYPPGVSSRDPDWDYCFKTFVTKSKALSQPISEDLQDNPDIDISLVQLCEDGGIEQVITKWPLQQYTMYRSRMREAETNEEVLVVLKEFNIVPKEITLIELKKNLEKSMYENSLIKPLARYIVQRIDDSAYSINCWVTSIDAQLGGTIFPSLYSPYLVYYLVSNSSGYVKTKCGDVYGNIRILMLVFLGIISGLDPIIDFDGCSIEGFCLYVVAQQI